ncbi:Hpt domain-containing protein [Herbaspirillum rhizosphaerae]|uniref:histidine kinase n=1 Tax=Herbaspirillum rhizosphaerae TaxID=346179 RepID=A0ABW8ZFE5_9BURK
MSTNPVSDTFLYPAPDDGAAAAVNSAALILLAPGLQEMVVDACSALDNAKTAEEILRIGVVMQTIVKALLFIEEPLLAFFVNAIGQMLGDGGDGDLRVKAVAAAKRACLSLRHYLDAVDRLPRPCPLQLFAAYKTVAAVSNQEKVHPVELALPDRFSENELQFPPCEVATVTSSDATLSACRSEFEAALLNYQRALDADVGTQFLQRMAEIVQQIVRMPIVSPHINFWRVIDVAVGLFAIGEVDVDQYAKKFLGQVNLQLRRLVSGTCEGDTRLLREGLFFIALGPASNDKVRAFKQLNDLPDLYQRDYQQPFDTTSNTMRVVPSAPDSREAESAELATALARLESSIESNVNGSCNLSEIANAIHDFSLVAERLKFDASAKLLRADAISLERAAKAGEVLTVESTVLRASIHHLAALSLSLSLAQNSSPVLYRSKHEEFIESSAGTPELLARSEQHEEVEAIKQAEGATSINIESTTAAEPTEEDLDQELLEIFLMEADDILCTMDKALTASRSAREDMAHVTVLRRCFHTLKGSCRMVGLHAMSDGAMAVESFLNDWLAEASPGTEAGYTLLDYAKREVAIWIDEIRQHGKSHRHPDAMIVAVQSARQDVTVDLQDGARKAAEGIALASQDSEESIRVGDMEISVQLHQIYCAESENLLAVVAAHLEQWRHVLPEVIDPEMLRATHSLKSSSASVQFAALKTLAHTLDDVMQFVEHSPAVLDADACRSLVQIVQQLQSMQQLFASRRMPPAREDLQQQLLSLLETLKVRREEASSREQEISHRHDEVSVPELNEDDLGLGLNSCDDTCTDLIDPELLEIFLEEGRDLLPQIGESLHQLQKSPDDRRLIQHLLRPLHTIKGSARMAGAMHLGQYMHELETSIDEMVRDGVSSNLRIDDLLARYDHGLQLFEALQKPSPMLPPASPQLLVSDEQPQAMPGPRIVAPGVEIGAGSSATIEADTGKSVNAAPLVRIRAGILDNLLNQAGEMSISRSGLESEVNVLRRHLADLGGNVSRLTTQLRELEIQAEIQIAASNQRLPQNQHFDPLEFDRFTHLQEMTRMLAESVNDVASLQKNLLETVDHTQNSLTQQARLTREMQQELMQARMVQFRGVEERLHRLVRQMAKETGKELELDIQGGTVELDRSILEKMVGPFEHLLRNAAAHGIETVEQRRNAGKPTIGKLSLQVKQEGYEVMIRLSDDGQGLDLARIHEKALRLGLIDVDRQWSDVELKGLIFQPGFTTSTDVTAIAGRGVGMDVVRSEVASLGGRISIDTVAGQGATFIIHLPLSLAVTQVVLLELGEQTYAIPSLLVEQVLQLKADRQAEVFRDGSLDWQGRKLAMHYLPVLLGEDKGVPAQQTLSILVVKSGHDFLAILVDRIIGNREVVTKNIGPQLAHMVGVVGATVLGSGSIALILNPIQLAQRHGYQKVLRHVEPVVTNRDHGKKTILVVDDSLTVRRVMQRLLTREGYHVVLATDGVDALHQLQSVRPDIALVDIEMPRMDGFDLTRNIRDMSSTGTLPIIMITSRTAAKHRERAMELGVNEYLGKPYQDDVLLKMIVRLTGEQGRQPPAHDIDELLFKPSGVPSAQEDGLSAPD